MFYQYDNKLQGGDITTKKYKIIAVLLILITFIFNSALNELISKISYTLFMKDNSQLTTIINHNILNDNNGIKYIGHRGLGGLAPENTLPAFDLAGKLGFWGTECDVRTTMDGNWVISHDSNVKRMTNGTGEIRKLPFSKIKSLTINSGNNITKYKKIKIPKLQDYLLTCNRWGITPVIEIKDVNNLKYYDYDKFIEIIKKYGNIKNTIVISFSAKNLTELRKRNNYLTLGLLCTNINKINIHYVKTLGNAFIDTSYIKITKSKIDLCHKNNIKVGVWIVDNTALANILIQNGIDYLTTNKLLPEKNDRIFKNSRE